MYQVNEGELHSPWAHQGILPSLEQHLKVQVGFHQGETVGER